MGEFGQLAATPGATAQHAKKAAEVVVLGKDGRPAQVGQSVGFWPEVGDYVTTVEQRFGRPGFPRGWPDCYTSSKALRRLLGKKGLKGAMSKTVDLLSKSDLRRELPELANKLRADQSFANAQEVERAKGWRIVKGFAVYDLYDCPEGEAYVGYRHWWNVNDDDTWVDFTPPETGSQTHNVLVRLLVESELGDKEEKVLEYGAHMQALSLLKEKAKMEKEAAKMVAMRSTEDQKRKITENVMGSFGSSNAQTAQALSADSAMMIASEAERLIEGLKTFGVESVGSEKWMEQHDTLTRLNLQAHHNVAAMSEEFVKEAFISLDKVNDVVHELLIAEIWKEKVYPHLGAEVLEGQVGSTNVYLALYHESVVVNILEIIFYHKEALEAVSSDALLELVDYCHRKIAYLNSGKAKDDAEFVNRTAQELIALDKLQDMNEKMKDLRFGIALSAVSILRYMTDYGNELPLGVMARMLDTHDTIVQLCPLLEERPWVRRRVRGTGKEKVRFTEAFNEGRWQTLPPEDRLKLSKTDAQIWISLHNLVTDPKCRGKYRYDDFRRETVSRLQRHFNDVLFDQIPMLQDLQRIVSEVVFMVTPSAADITQGRLILEQVPELRDALLSRNDWREIAREQVATVFADTPENLEKHKQKMDNMLQAFDFMSMLSGEGGGLGDLDMESLMKGMESDEDMKSVMAKIQSEVSLRTERAHAAPSAAAAPATPASKAASSKPPAAPAAAAPEPPPPAPAPAFEPAPARAKIEVLDLDELE